MRRKVILSLLIVLFGLIGFVGEKPYGQEAFPTKPIILLVPFPPGGVVDMTARSYAPAASKLLGQPVAVINKPGAGGTIAADALAASKADGYTLLQCGGGTLAHGFLTQGVKWGPKEFTVILGHSTPNFAFVVRSDAPWKNFDEWVQYVRSNPGFKYGCYGNLVTMHLVMEWVGKRLGIKLVPVHLKGEPEGVQNLLGGHVQAHCFAGGQHALIKAGKLKTLLQVTGYPLSDADPKAVTQLMDALPDAPLDILILPNGIFAPKGLPERLQMQLTEVFKKATIDNPEFVRVNQMMASKINYTSPKELQADLIKAHEGFGELVKSLGLERK